MQIASEIAKLAPIAALAACAFIAPVPAPAAPAAFVHSAVAAGWDLPARTDAVAAKEFAKPIPLARPARDSAWWRSGDAEPRCWRTGLSVAREAGRPAHESVADAAGCAAGRNAAPSPRPAHRRN